MPTPTSRNLATAPSTPPAARKPQRKNANPASPRLSLTLRRPCLSLYRPKHNLLHFRPCPRPWIDNVEMLRIRNHHQFRIFLKLRAHIIFTETRGHNVISSSVHQPLPRTNL